MAPSAARSQSHLQPRPQPPLEPQLETQPHMPPHPPSSVVPSPSSSRLPNETRKPSSTTFSLRRPFRPNPSSTSLVPSTAEGKPIPVDDSTVESRTTALRELNNNYPSRHRYAKSTGAQSSTYSEPVIVRSYYSPHLTRPASSARARAGHSGAASAADGRGVGASVRRGLPFSNQVTAAGTGMLSKMVRARGKDLPGPASDARPDAHLPPVEAFSFKSFMANMEQQGGPDDISADLDRIAEICAKSRYSLSNQYEVHYTPHGSGTGFLEPTAQEAENPGPTLQAISSSEDERSMSTQRKRRRMGARRNSRAMGTLETIMSSSRSSDEDRSRKKSAAELAEEVRGRALHKESGASSPATSPVDDAQSQKSEHAPRTPTERRPSSLALIDGAKHISAAENTSTAQTSAAALVGEPALPQASTRQLEIRTIAKGSDGPGAKPRAKSLPSESLAPPFAKGAISSMEQASRPGLFSTLSGWIPWRTVDTSATTKGRAEGSLRDLLKAPGNKGKSVERL